MILLDLALSLLFVGHEVSDMGSFGYWDSNPPCNHHNIKGLEQIKIPNNL